MNEPKQCYTPRVNIVTLWKQTINATGMCDEHKHFDFIQVSERWRSFQGKATYLRRLRILGVVGVHKNGPGLLITVASLSTAMTKNKKQVNVASCIIITLHPS